MDEETQAYDATLEEVKGNVYELSGVSVMDDADTYKSTYKVLEDISKVWDKLTDKQKAGTLENLFGKRQANVGAAIISNFSQAQKAIQMMGDSTGSAEQEFAKAQQGISYKLNALKETSVGIWQNLIDSDAIKTGVDALTKLLEIIDKLTEVLGSTGGISLAAGLFANSKGFNIIDEIKKIKEESSLRANGSSRIDEIQKQYGDIFEKHNNGEDISVFTKNDEALKKYIDNLKGANATAKDMAKTQSSLTSNVKSSIGGFSGAGTAIKGFAASIGKALVTAGAMYVAMQALNFVFTTFDHIANKQKYLDESASDVANSYQETANKLDEANTKLKENKDRIKEIKAQGKLTYTDKAEISKLESANTLLEQQISLLKEKQKIEATDSALLQSEALTNKLDDRWLKDLDSVASSKTIKEYKKHNDYSGKKHNYSKSDFNWEDDTLNSILSNIPLIGDWVSQSGQKLDVNELIAIYQQTSKEIKKVNSKSKDFQSIQTGYEESSQGLIDYMSTIDDAMAQMQDGYQIAKQAKKDNKQLTSDQKQIIKDYENFGKIKDKIQKVINPDEYKATKISEILNKKDIELTEKQLKKLAKSGKLEDLDLSKYSKLSKALKDAGISAKDFKTEISAMANPTTGDWIDTQDEKIKSYTEAVDSAKDLFKDFNTALDESRSTSGMTTDSIDNIEKMFSRLKGYNASTLFEKTANGISLNKVELRELTKEYIANQKVKYAEELQKLVDKYNKVSASISKCTSEKEREKKYNQLSDITNQIEAVKQLASQYDGLTSAYSQWEQAMSGSEDGDTYDSVVDKLDDIEKIYENGDIGTDKFRASAQLMTNKDLSTASVNEVVEAYRTGITKMKRYFKEGTDGTENFLKDVQSKNKEWAHMNKDGSWEINFPSDKEVADAIGINVESVEQILRKLRDQGFEIHIETDSAVKNIATLKEEAKEAEKELNNSHLSEYKINLKVDKDNIDQSISDVKAEFDKLQSGFDAGTLTDQQMIDYDNLKSVLEYLIKKKEELTKPAYMKIDTTTLSGDRKTGIEALQKYQDAKNELEKATILNIDTSEAEQNLKNAKLAVFDLEDSVKESIGINPESSKNSVYKQLDSGKVTGKKNKDAKSDKDKTTKKEEKIIVSAEVDTQSFQGVQAVGKTVQELKDKKVKVDFETSGEKTLESVKKTAEGIKDNKAVVEVTSKGYKGVEKLAKETTKFKNKKATMLAKAKGINKLKSLNAERNQLTDKKFTITASLNDQVSAELAVLQKNIQSATGAGINLSSGKASSSNSSKSSSSKSTSSKSKKSSNKGKNGVGGLNGTAHVRGTAYSTGNWGAKHGGRALSGELGKELWIHGSTGKWETVGDNGAEFINVRPGDVIFNKDQTEQLLDKGFTDSYGQSFLNGTAYKKGTKTAISSVANAIKSIGTYGGGSFLKKSSGTSSSKKKKSSSKSSSSSDSSSSSSDEKSEENLDWIERALKLVDRVVKNVQQAVDNVYNNWSKRNSQIYDEIYQLGQQLNYYQAGYDSYMAQANAVQLDESYKKKIREGNFSIETITDENLKTAVSRYKELYDNAMDCADKLQEIRESIGDAYKKAFDNIAKEFENRIKQLDDSITNLESRFELSKYKSSGFNNDYLSNQIDLYTSKSNELTNEISSLENKLREAVNSGYVDSYSEAYQEMSSTLSDLRNQLVETEKSISETYEKIFENVSTKYEKQIEYYQSFIDQLDKSKTLAETKGRIASESYYKAMITYQKKNIENMKSQEKALTDSLNQALATNSIVAYSEKWYELTNSIHEVQQSLEEANNTLEEFKNNIRQIKWDKFDYLEDEISKITEEAKFFEDLFDNETLYDTDTGKNTKYGDAMLGLHAVSYSTYKSQANDYAKAIKELDKEFKNDSLNKDYLDRRNELVKSQREFILNANDEKQAIKDLIKNGYDAQLNALKELIDKRKDLLSQQKDLYDYEKQIEEKTKNISTLQKQLNAYSGDDSEESLKNIQSIKSDLQDAKDELDQTEYDKYISDQEAMLDNLATDFEDWINQRLEEFNANFDKVLEGIDTNASSISATINEAAKQNGIDLSSSFNTIFNSNTSTITGAIGDVTGALSPISSAISQIKTYVEFMYSQAKAEADRKAAEQKAKEEAERKAAEEAKRKQQEEAARRAAEAQAKAQQQAQAQQQNDRRNIFTYKADSYPKNKLNISHSVVDALKYVDMDSSFGKRAQYYSALGGSGSYTGSSSQNTWLLSQVRSIFGFAQGGEIGALKSVIKGNGDDSLAINTFKQGEKIIPLNRVPEWDKLIDTLPTLNGVLSNVGSSNVEVGQFNVTLPNVKNYQEFKEALVKDNSFNKAIAVMLDSSINNKNSLNRLRFK